jgi:hypothetical protein
LYAAKQVKSKEPETEDFSLDVQDLDPAKISRIVYHDEIFVDEFKQDPDELREVKTFGKSKAIAPTQIRDSETKFEDLDLD